VFSPPVRAALDAWRCRPPRDGAAYDTANRANKESSEHNIGIPRQCFGIFPKLDEADRLMTPEFQCRIKESHPEVAFTLLNRGTPLQWNKHTKEGRNDRRRLLFDAGLREVERILPEYRSDSRVAADDILDALALVATAKRIVRGEAERIPADPPCDARGLRMEMWW
jgi:predicted RNase H-like nuclease